MVGVRKLVGGGRVSVGWPGGGRSGSVFGRGWAGTGFAKGQGMARPLRFVPAGSVVEVTTRTIQGRLLLRPGPEVNELILGILGRAQALFPVRVHAFVVLSNHWHGLFSVTDAAQLAAFVGFVNGNIAREIGRLHRWRDRFWARRYRSIVVADEQSQPARLRYILQNGCKEGLVDRPRDWPGPTCVHALTRGKKLRGTWYDRTAEARAPRRRRSSARVSFAQSYEVELTPLPCWKSCSEAQHRAHCLDLVTEIEAEIRQERGRSGKPCVGVSRLSSLEPHSIPENIEKSPAPFVHASCHRIRLAFRQAYAAFVDAFRTAAGCLRRGVEAHFPMGAFPPSCPFVSLLAEAA
jgi:putative transposase